MKTYELKLNGLLYDRSVDAHGHNNPFIVVVALKLCANCCGENNVEV